ncbi:MAG: hypothetical protein LBG52_06355 [Candidatus Peribacteria bacterium]|jgi:ABC-type transport system involved in cytochrome c biogenesis permease subunit|nr:hypothetical protein [Candidatus Peribacteria bacterium]
MSGAALVTRLGIWMIVIIGIGIRMMYLSIICFFKKGTRGENKYGSDSLPRQQTFENKAYRILGIGIILLTGILKTIMS